MGIKRRNIKKKGGRPRKNLRPEDFIRLSENAKPERFAEMGKRVAKGELKRAFYGIDGNVGYHYYRKLK